MSDESISCGEDKENLLYISKKLNVQGFGLEEDHYLGSLKSDDSGTCVEFAGSDASLVNKLSKDVGPKTFQNSKLNARLKPFHHMITSISCDSSGRWVVTADSDPDGVMIFWDSTELKPVLTLFNIYPESGVLAAEISPCARYVITIGRVDETYRIDFWLWTSGEEIPKDSVTVIAHVAGIPIKICFNAENEEHIMLVFQKQVYLFTWSEEKRQLIGPNVPQITHRNKIGHLTSGTYISRSHASYASSSRGCILIFRHSLHNRAYEEVELRNDKVFINAVRVTLASIGVVTTTDGTLVVGDSKGHIYFFDYRVRILYWFRQFPLAAITSISFNLAPKEYEYVGDRLLVKCRSLDDSNVLDCEYKDITEEIDKICSVEVPFDASLKNKPFLMRNFFVSTSACNIYAIDFLSHISTPLFHTADANISAIEIHDEKPYIIMGFENGRLTITDYEKNEKICRYILPKAFEEHSGYYSSDDRLDAISCIRYSTESLHLVCGRYNGEIWILEPLTLDPKIQKPFTHTKNKVIDIAFASNSLQFAYYDSNRTVVLFVYDTVMCTWEYKGKVRSHYAPITDMKFSPCLIRSTLCSISEDRHLIQYNNVRHKSEQFGITSRERIDQFGMPTCFLYYSKIFYSKITDYLLIADNKVTELLGSSGFLLRRLVVVVADVLPIILSASSERGNTETYPNCFASGLYRVVTLTIGISEKGKLKLVHEVTKVPRATVIGPAYGCFKDSPIRKMKLLPDLDMRYMVFLCKNHIGLHMLPPDGNPYKYNGSLAHPKEVVDFVTSSDGKYMFTFGTDDRCVLMWEILPRSVEVMHILGGKELEPFYCLLEGGKNGWLFQEIQDLFFYMQIVKQENIDLPRRVSDNIPLSEVPDLVRACGFYPSDFELESMLIDIKYRDHDESGTIREEISFTEFVKLFINHRPAYGYSLNELKRNFDVITKMAEYPKLNKIETSDMVDLLENAGETCNLFQKHLATLMRTKVPSGSKIMDHLPTDITADFFFGELLGIDLERDEPEPQLEDSIILDDENIDENIE